jgi:hypothetical protein
VQECSERTMSKISVVQDVGCSAREKGTTKERSKSFHSRLWWTERRRREERGGDEK